jgi:hypothetical protein
MQRGWEDKELSCRIPTFKIQPKVFVRLASQMTILQQDFPTEAHILHKHLYPVTLPRDEAAQNLKVILASGAMAKGEFSPLLPRINFAATKYNLSYLPFRAMGLDMIQEHTGISINKNALKFGRALQA